jgi:hypothetical protein
MARAFDREVAKLQIRVAVQNGHTSLGIPVTVALKRFATNLNHSLSRNALG